MKEISQPENDHIQGIGTDIIEIHRIHEAIIRHGDRFLERLFTPQEIQYCKRYQASSLRFAGRFAAKEAILKALGTGLYIGITWKDIEILNNSQGKPEATFSKRLSTHRPNCRIHLTISHCDTFATATAIIANTLMHSLPS